VAFLNDIIVDAVFHVFLVPLIMLLVIVMLQLRFLFFDVVDDVDANSSVDAMVAGLPDGVNDNIVEDCGANVDAVNVATRIEATNTSTNTEGTSPATIYDASVVDAARLVVSGAIDIVMASDFAFDVT
jgi:hypothetical protein